MYMNFFERTQVLSSLAGVPKWETRPETGSACKQCPCWRKGRRGEQGSGVSSEGLTPSPRGVGTGPAGGRVGGGMPAAGMVCVRVPRRSDWSSSCAPSRALLLACRVLFAGTTCPKGWERASRHQLRGETENFPATSNVLQAYQRCTGRPNVPNCSSRCGRRENHQCLQCPEQRPEHRKCLLSSRRAKELYDRHSSTPDFPATCDTVVLCRDPAAEEEKTVSR